jgi:hypothetical protein
VGTAGISILGSFAKLRKVTISFVIMSVRMEQLGSHFFLNESLFSLYFTGGHGW